MTEPLDTILSRLDAVRPAGDGRWMARCPAHQDRTPSLSIADNGESVLMHCHAGCDVRDVCGAIGLRLRDLFIAGPAGTLPSDELSERITRSHQYDQAARDAKQEARYKLGATSAREIWRASRPAPDTHPYLMRKGVPAHGLRQRGFQLIVPVVYRGLLVNLQRISCNGNKVFLKNGRVRGCYSPIGKIEASKPLYVCEGWATAASLYAREDCAAACAFTANNLFAAADELQAMHPGIELIIAGDDDRQTEGNPGRSAAAAAAAVLGCKLIFPPWPDDAPRELSDFNDYANWSAVHV